MHRLFSISTILVSGLLISVSVIAQPASAGDDVRKDITINAASAGGGAHVRVFDGTSSNAATDKNHKQWSDILSANGQAADESTDSKHKSRIDLNKAAPGSGPQAGKSTPKLQEKILKGKVHSRVHSAKIQRLKTARSLGAQWKPGLSSRNVRIKRITPMRGGRGIIVIEKPRDRASLMLSRLARSGRVLPGLELAGTDARGQYLKYKLSRCFIKSWSTSGDADDRPTEEVAVSYTRID